MTTFLMLEAGQRFHFPPTNEEFLKLDGNRAFCLSSCDELPDENSVVEFVGGDENASVVVRQTPPCKDLFVAIVTYRFSQLHYSSTLVDRDRNPING